MRPGRVIVVTGPPGAGKSTVGRMLADALPLSVHLHSDDFWHYIRQGAIGPYRPEAHHQNEVVIGVVADAALGYAAGGYDVICDGVVGPWFLNRFHSAAAVAGTELHYLVLRPDVDTALRRATGRTASDALVDPGPIRSLHEQFADLGTLESHVLDSTGQQPRATAELALRGIEDGSYVLGAAVRRDRRNTAET